jgi:hypothetical protein
MAAPVVIAPVVAEAVAANGLRIAIQAGASYGLGIELAGLVRWRQARVP